MVINKCDITIPDNGIYCYNDCMYYKFEGKIIDVIYDALTTSKSAYKKLMCNYKTVANNVGCTNTYAKALLIAFYKTYVDEYYNNINNIQWLFSVIKKSNIVSISIYKGE